MFPRLRLEVTPASSLSPPPRDELGKVIPHDHEGITNDDWAIRRVSDRHLVYDPKIGGKKISSILFSASTGINGGMSVDLQKQIEEAGADVKAFVTTPRWMGSVRFMVGPLRSEKFMVGSHPTKPNPYHGEVWGDFSNSRQDKLKKLCEWFVPIQGVSIF